MMSGHSRPSKKGREVLSHALTDRHGQVQNVKAARVYVFGDGNQIEDDLDENVEYEMPEIRARRGPGSAAAVTEPKQAEEETFFDRRRLMKEKPFKACPSSMLVR